MPTKPRISAWSPNPATSRVHRWDGPPKNIHFSASMDDARRINAGFEAAERYGRLVLSGAFAPAANGIGWRLAEPGSKPASRAALDAAADALGAS